MTTASTKPHSRIALQELVAGLADPANHYIVKAHSYESEGRTWYLAVIHLHQAIVWNVELDEETFACDIQLTKYQPQNKSRIRVACNQVWSIAWGSDAKCDNEDNRLYYNLETLADYPLAAECAQCPV